VDTRRKGVRKCGNAPRDTDQQLGRQQGHHTGKLAWKSNFKILDNQPGTGQKGQHPVKGEPFGSTPGEVRGHPGGKKGQAKGGRRRAARRKTGSR